MKKNIITISLLFILTIIVYLLFFGKDNNIIKEWTTMNCNISNVTDWDTIDLLCWDKTIKNNRLLWIDAPELWYWKEKDGCMSLEAKHFMEKLSYNEIEWLKIYKEFRVDFYGKDDCIKWGCRNEIVIYDTETEDNVNKMLVAKWYAYVWDKYLYRKVIKKDIRDSFSKSIKTFPKYTELQNQAIIDKKWIWWKCNVSLNKTNKWRLYIIK